MCLLFCGVWFANCTRLRIMIKVRCVCVYKRSLRSRNIHKITKLSQVLSDNDTKQKKNIRQYKMSVEHNQGWTHKQIILWSRYKTKKKLRHWLILFNVFPRVYERRTKWTEMKQKKQAKKKEILNWVLRRESFVFRINYYFENFIIVIVVSVVRFSCARCRDCMWFEQIALDECVCVWVSQSVSQSIRQSVSKSLVYSYQG